MRLRRSPAPRPEWNRCKFPRRGVTKRTHVYFSRRQWNVTTVQPRDPRLTIAFANEVFAAAYISYFAPREKSNLHFSPSKETTNRREKESTTRHSALFAAHCRDWCCSDSRKAILQFERGCIYATCGLSFYLHVYIDAGFSAVATFLTDKWSFHCEMHQKYITECFVREIRIVLNRHIK